MHPELAGKILFLNGSIFVFVIPGDKFYKLLPEYVHSCCELARYVWWMSTAHSRRKNNFTVTKISLMISKLRYLPRKYLFIISFLSWNECLSYVINVYINNIRSPINVILDNNQNMAIFFTVRTFVINTCF